MPHALWNYLHARTVARIWPRLKPPIPDYAPAVGRFLCAVAASRPRFAVLQVGAYDGVSNDPVHEVIRACPHVCAVLLEPQPGPFARLMELWRGSDRVAPVRCALADTVGERPLYGIAGPYRHLHPFPDQIASFSRSHVETQFSRYVWRPPRDFLTAIPVPCVDWPTLVRERGPFDLVAIDVEGYDGEILHQMDLSADTAPDIILYEHRNLTRELKRRAASRLQKAGYTVRRVNKADTIAVVAALTPALRAVLDGRT